MKLGVDLGGTKIEAIILGEGGGAVWRERIITPQGDYGATLSAVEKIVSIAKHENHLPQSMPIGIGTPGALCVRSSFPAMTMKNCNSTALNGKPLLRDLSELLKCPVSIANDANCMVLAETLSGQGEKLFKNDRPESVFGVILGTGVGGGLVIHDRLVQGANHISGEWGHNPLPSTMLDLLPLSEKHRRCYCGRLDCVETYLSGPGLALSYSLRFGGRISPEDILNNMREGKEQATIIWEQYLNHLACSLAVVLNILDPSLIVLGGGLSNIDEIYFSINERIQQYVFTDTFETSIVPALLGDSAGVYGAAWLV